jgi:hypothetical protein
MPRLDLLAPEDARPLRAAIVSGHPARTSRPWRATCPGGGLERWFAETVGGSAGSTFS